MRSGVNPSKVKLRFPMPVHLIKNYTDAEVRAQWAYLSAQKSSADWASESERVLTSR